METVKKCELNDDSLKEEGELSDEDDGEGNGERKLDKIPHNRNEQNQNDSNNVKTTFEYNHGLGPGLPYDRIRLPPFTKVHQRPLSDMMHRDHNKPRPPPRYGPGVSIWQGSYDPLPRQKQPTPAKFWEKRRFRPARVTHKNPEDHESDFEKLLENYKSIKEKLDDIDKKEKQDKRLSKKNEQNTSSIEKQSEDDGTVESKESSSRTDVPKESTSAVSQGAGDEEDDDDIDELELRRIALESTLGKREAAKEETESMESVENHPPPPKSTGKYNQMNRKTRNTRTPRNKRNSGSMEDRRRSSEGNRPRRNSGGGVRRSEKINRQKREEERRREEEEYRRKKEEMKQITQEIEKILALDDPKEQLSRLLSNFGLSKDKSSLDKSPSDKKQNSGPSKPREKTPTLQDNYEEVEMDIDSESGSPVVTLENIGGLDEEVPYDPEFFHLMQQEPLLGMPGGSETASLMDSGVYPYQNTDAMMMDSTLMYPMYHPVPLLPPPLPPDDLVPQLPPLPAEKPPSPPPLPPPSPPPLPSQSPPPLPSEPPPDEGRVIPALMSLILVPPPPPPLPPPEEDNHPPPSSGEDNNPEEEGDEAALLREHLLKSMQSKKKEKERLEKIKEEDKSSAASSPVSSSRGQSPIPAVKQSKPQQVNRKKHTPVPQMMQYPVQKPVVINLAEDSSDEEEEIEEPTKNDPFNLLGGLDLFLKEARKSVQVNQEASMSQQTKKIDPEVELREKVKKFEEELIKQRTTIIKEQAIFKGLLGKAGKYKKAVDNSAQNVVKLKEQLEAAEKIYTANKEQFDVVRKQARMLRDRIQQKTAKFQELEKTTIENGQKLYGDSYKPRTIVAVKSSDKKQVPDLTVTVFNENAVKKIAKGKENRNTATVEQMKKNVEKKPSAENITAEKERLQVLAMEYEKKIQQLKLAQEKKELQRKQNQMSKKTKSEIPRLEKIEIDTTDMNEKSEVKPSKRRRSLLDISTSMKPIFSNSEEVNRSVNGSEHDQNLKDVVEKSNAETIKIQNKQQWSKLCKLRDENFETFLNTQKRNISSCIMDHAILLPKNNEISVASLQPYKDKLKSQSDIGTSSSLPFVYRSSLLRFKSYRFSPYFRTKENLTIASPTFSNKINPHKIFCKFDLQGTCHDEDCKGQHESYYKMTEEEILQDIISYYPSMAGIPRETRKDQFTKTIGNYVSSVMKQHKGSLTSDQLNLLTASQVSEQSKHVKPHMMFLQARKWRVTQTEKQKNVDKDLNSDADVFDKIEWSKPVAVQDTDNVIGEQDTRYFVTDSTSVQDLESSVLQNTDDIELWIRLAYRKLYEPNSSPETALDYALNVLARGLEANRNSAELWQTYLTFYTKHKDSSDLIELCETALQYAQNYNIWWQYLDASISCIKKLEICDNIFLYLQSDKDTPPEVVSHRITEIVLYKTSLYIWSGRYKTALKFLQELVMNKDQSEWLHQCMCVPDKCVLWLSYINLKEFKQLPESLYDPANQYSGKIVNKEKIMIAWDSKPELSSDSVDSLVELLWTAVSTCVGPIEPDNTDIGLGLVLYLNSFNLLKLHHRLEEAASMCRKLLLAWPVMVDIWLCVGDLYSTCGDAVATRQVFADAYAANPHCVQLYYYAANFELLQGEPDKALECLEQCVVSIFDVEQRSLQQTDPNYLYSFLLGEEVPFNVVVPPFREGINPSNLEGDKLYLWLNYCLLLELQDRADQSVEAYETALSMMDTVQDITKVWSSYLSFCQKQLKNKTTNTKQFVDLVNRCITTIPTKFEMPYTTGHYWLNYTHVNQIIEQVIEGLSTDDKLATYESFINGMPGNLDLILRASRQALTEEDQHRSKIFCTTAIHENIPNSNIWKMYISLARKLDGLKELRKMYHKAVQVFPYSASMWKDFLLFEVTQGNTEVVPKILKKCRELGVNVEEFVKYITAL